MLGLLIPRDLAVLSPRRAARSSEIASGPRARTHRAPGASPGRLGNRRQTPPPLPSGRRCAPGFSFLFFFFSPILMGRKVTAYFAFINSHHNNKNPGAKGGQQAQSVARGGGREPPGRGPPPGVVCGHRAGGADQRCPRMPARCPSPSSFSRSGAVRRGHGAPASGRRYFSLQIGSLRGLAATRKCILALRAAEGAGQGRHSPAQPRASLETLGTRRGPAAGGVTSPSFLLLPFHVGHATWGDASSSGPRHGPRGSPGSIRPPPRPLSRPALYSAPRLQLPPGPRAGHGCRPRLVRSGAGRPQGALALPDPRSGRASQGGSAGCGARGDWSMCWNLPRCVRYEKPTVFTHLEMSFCCLDVAGAILKALPRSGHQAL
ncbi:translation initiation factor IF-2-like isoform X1 [Mus musculus]|uniref:translation initiation factor IF-2-like isoform X1 n=1 Tax=Mus musculus TaxID=10090 RepID=UPI001672C6FB|nr:translation initiation factor IF-2-like isoform X1 [Mus musculus]